MIKDHPFLEIGKSERDVPFELHTMQWINQNKGQQNAVPHRHNYYVIIWVKSGSGVHYIDLNKFDITENTIYCLSPGQIHLMNANEDIDGWVLSFSADFLCLTEENYDLLFKTGLFYTFTQSPVIQVTAEMQTELEEVILKMRKEYDNFFLLRSEILRGYLKIFLIHLTRQFDQSQTSPPQTRNIELVKNFLSLLEQNFTTKKMVVDYANELGVTPNYLNEMIKKATGFPASDHIKHRVSLEAKRHAVYSDVSMKEIAFNLGFDDVAHFSKYFKNATGINFSDFKKNSSAHFS